LTQGRDREGKKVFSNKDSGGKKELKLGGRGKKRNAPLVSGPAIEHTQEKRMKHNFQ